MKTKVQEAKVFQAIEVTLTLTSLEEVQGLHQIFNCPAIYESAGLHAAGNLSDEILSLCPAAYDGHKHHKFTRTVKDKL